MIKKSERRNSNILSHPRRNNLRQSGNLTIFPRYFRRVRPSPQVLLNFG